MILTSVVYTYLLYHMETMICEYINLETRLVGSLTQNNVKLINFCRKLFISSAIDKRVSTYILLFTKPQRKYDNDVKPFDYQNVKLIDLTTYGPTPKPNLLTCDMCFIVLKIITVFINFLL